MAAGAAEADPILFCLGDPLLDIQVSQGAEELLRKYGLEPNGAIRATDAHAALYDELELHCPTLVAGGAAQNTARAAAYILPPGAVVYSGCVGSDTRADILRAANVREGVRSAYNVHPTEQTGACAVLLTGSNRSLVTTLRAAGKYDIAHLDTPEMKLLVSSARVFYTTGFFLTNGIETQLRLARHAVETGKMFVFNISAPYVPQVHFDKLTRLLPYCDIILGNDADAFAYAAAAGLPRHSTLPAIAQHMAQRPLAPSEHKPTRERERVVIITHGADPAIVVVGSGADAPREVPGERVPLDELVDTNGAGDAFAGGFLAAWILGRELDECLRVAHRMGAMCVRHVGPQYTFPKTEIL